jgi:hypothetical protein
MAKRPLPPLPAAVAAPAHKKRGRRATATPESDTPPARGGGRGWGYLGAVIGLLILVGLLLAFSPLASFLWPAGNGEKAALANQVRGEAATIPTPSSPPSSASSVGDELSLPAPSSTPPEPQLLADSRADFSSTPGIWDYLWSPPNEDNWSQLHYEKRQYGACWYGQDYIRICADSAHPGNGADIAWFWKSKVSGPVEVRIRAGKKDSGGDGVVIAVYRNTTQTSAFPEFKKSLAGNDRGGFAEKFEIDHMAPGDYLLFVMQRNGDATSDHTAFQALICRYRCP